MLAFLRSLIAAPLCQPSPDECAEDYAWHRERHAEPDLLDHAIGVKIAGDVWLAVPVGGSRSGGSLYVSTMVQALRAWAALRGRPGFPHARIGVTFHREVCHSVMWGSRQPRKDAERHQYFGFTPVTDDPRQELAYGLPPQQEARIQIQDTGRSGEHGPLRAWGGWVAAILIATVVSVRVSAARGTRKTEAPKGHRGMAQHPPLAHTPVADAAVVAPYTSRRRPRSVPATILIGFAVLLLSSRACRRGPVCRPTSMSPSTLTN
ncbi:DUF6302 family protein [Streptomyces venezuelae]|uniref:DUF6302 family protein n=1 Tax=Streptomyces venezuelae TaxID=54571 RepID=UPI00341FF580